MLSQRFENENVCINELYLINGFDKRLRPPPPPPPPPRFRFGFVNQVGSGSGVATPIVKTPYELWTSKKPSLKHLQIWGCLAEARPYKPHEKKLDSRTVSCCFIGYSERSRGYKFYDPTTKSIFETGNAQLFEDVEFDEGDKDWDFVFEEEYVDIPIAVIDIDQDPIPNIV